MFKPFFRIQRLLSSDDDMCLTRGKVLRKYCTVISSIYSFCILILLTYRFKSGSSFNKLNLTLVQRACTLNPSL